MTELFTIYTYGGGEVVHNIFNAIAVIYQLTLRTMQISQIIKL